jgi:penicillin-binding protein 1A
VSLNTVPVRILERLGKEESFYFLKDTLGMNSLIEEKRIDGGVTLTDMDVASLALGQMNYGVTVREITAGYTAFVNMGNYCKPRSYYLVTDCMGNVLLENGEVERRAISRDNASVMNQMLMNVVDVGTAEGIKLDKITPVAGKTGTSQDYYDRWFIGYTPLYIGGVWYGYEYPKALENDTKHICTEIWDDVMSEIYRVKGSDTSVEFDKGENVIRATYCKDSGKLMTDACRNDARGNRSQRGYFVKGTEPTEQCDRHILVKYDKVHGGVADPSCPEYNLTEVGLILAERHFPIQIYVSDAQYVYRELPGDVLPGDSEDEPFFINLLRKGEWCGISYSEKQFNCYCSAHFNYLAWLLRRNLHN